MAVGMRTIVTRADGSRVTELRSGTPLDRMDSGEAGELDRLLMAWSIAGPGSKVTTAALAVGSARRAIQREAPDSILRIQRVSVTAARLPRVLRTYP